VPITTSGDRGANPGASPAGVKGLFVDEIVRALQEFDVDLAVHSAKDLPSEDPEGIVVAAVPERASPYDVLVTRESKIGDGAVVGTSSLRRRGQLRAARPQFEIHDIRGNVDTRLRKLEDHRHRRDENNEHAETDQPEAPRGTGGLHRAGQVPVLPRQDFRLLLQQAKRL